MPFPTGKEARIPIDDKSDSWFTIYDNYIGELFDVEKDTITRSDGTESIVDLKGKDGSNVLKLKTLTPEKIKLLSEFIREVNKNGLPLKGIITEDGNWKPTQTLMDEWINAHELDDGIVQQTSNSLKNLGFKSLKDMKSAFDQIYALINEHNLYLRHTDSRTREQMAKNMCAWTMYQVCSTPSNLTELMTGVDEATAPIKDKKTGAVAQSPYNGDDKQAAPGNYNTIHKSFQEGQIGKQCVGIGAVSIKVNSTTQYYIDEILRNGSEKDKERLLLPYVNKWGKRVDKGGTRGYYIGGKTFYGLSNIYDKNSETSQLRKIKLDGVEKNVRMAENNEDIIRMLDSIQTEADLTPNVAMSLAAMLSVNYCGGLYNYRKTLLIAKKSQVLNQQPLKVQRLSSNRVHSSEWKQRDSLQSMIQSNLYGNIKQFNKRNKSNEFIGIYMSSR